MGRWQDETGATAVEYGLVVGTVGIVFIVAGPALWRAMLTFLDTVVTAVLGG